MPWSAWLRRCEPREAACPAWRFPSAVAVRGRAFGGAGHCVRRRQTEDRRGSLSRFGMSVLRERTSASDVGGGEFFRAGNVREVSRKARF